MSRPIIAGTARAACVALCLMLGLALVPAANASFIGTDRADTSYTTATLLAPAEQQTNVTVTCDVLLLRATITVKNFGRVSQANFHEVKIYSGSGTSPVFTGDLSQQSGKTYTATYLVSGTWRVEIRGLYKVPGSTNVWTGPPLTRTVAC
ncbi:hypothetical protein J7E83_19595 [Arthrobacter sp. ISL-48]|uniref:hypothetical protein n=1 Tax=Arthrobacter sp. ISL-48 TaxID=2819110 RepID=UPI001BE4EADC|nr:hypothetical protein [Arthrobacter sp. ISL-48]MBT2534291.1 hypothetical protein [Arthrobacter sp. ISL-48]